MDADDALRLLSGLPTSAIEQRNLALLRHAPLFDIEVASACNVVCTFCPRHDMVRSRGLMDGDTFEAVLAFLPPGSEAMLSGLGDALLHPRLPQFVARLVERGVSACVITNGVRLNAQRQDALIEAGVAEVQVSVHGLTEEVVRRIVPVGADPSAVRRNVERLAALRGPRVRINFVETDENVGEKNVVEAWAGHLGARFFYRRQHTRGGTVGAPRRAECSGCGIFGSVTFISSDGNVLPCVNDVRGDGAMGNVRGLRWEEVLAWKRAVISSGRWFSACAACDDDYRWILLGNDGLAGA